MAAESVYRPYIEREVFSHGDNNTIQAMEICCRYLNKTCILWERFWTRSVGISVILSQALHQHPILLELVRDIFL
jgi:hypothetical protein